MRACVLSGFPLRGRRAHCRPSETAVAGCPPLSSRMLLLSPRRPLQVHGCLVRVSTAPSASTERTELLGTESSLFLLPAHAASPRDLSFLSYIHIIFSVAVKFKAYHEG